MCFYLFIFFLQNFYKYQHPLEDNESVLCSQMSYVGIFNRTKMLTFQIWNQVFKVDIHQKWEVVIFKRSCKQGLLAAVRVKSVSLDCKGHRPLQLYELL